MGAHERVNWHLCIFDLLDGHLVLVPSLLLLNNFTETWLSIRQTPLWDGQPRTSVLVLESVQTTSSLFHLIQIRFYTYSVASTSMTSASFLGLYRYSSAVSVCVGAGTWITSPFLFTTRLVTSVKMSTRCTRSCSFLIVFTRTYGWKIDNGQDLEKQCSNFLFMLSHVFWHNKV